MEAAHINDDEIPVEDDDYEEDEDEDEDEDELPEILHVLISADNVHYKPFAASGIPVVYRNDADLFQTNMNDAIGALHTYATATAPSSVEINGVQYTINPFVKSVPLSDYEEFNGADDANVNIFTSWQLNHDNANYENTAFILYYVTESHAPTETNPQGGYNVIVTLLLCANDKDVTEFTFNFITNLYDKLDGINIENIYFYNGNKQLLIKMPTLFEAVALSNASMLSLLIDIPMIITEAEEDPNYVFIKVKGAPGVLLAAQPQPQPQPQQLIQQLQNPDIPLKYNVIQSTTDAATIPMVQERRESLTRRLASNFEKHGQSMNPLLYVVSNPDDTSNEDLFNNIMISTNNIFISYKIISMTVNNATITNTYIMGLLIYHVTNSQIIVTHIVTFYNPEGGDMYNNFVNLYDTFKGLLDKYTWINNIYFYSANNQYMSFFTDAYIGWSVVSNITNLHRILNLHATNENYQVMIYVRKKIYPQINPSHADFIQLTTTPLSIPNDAKVFDFIEGIEVPISEYLAEDPQNIIFINTHNNALFYLASNRNTINDLLFKMVDNKRVPDYNNIFYGCIKTMQSFSFTEADLSGNTLYFNMAKLGASGTYLVNLFELLYVFMDDENKIYLLDGSSKESLVSMISVANFCKIYPDLVSSAHCQKGQGGSIYSIRHVVNSNTEPEPTTNKRLKTS